MGDLEEGYEPGPAGLIHRITEHTGLLLDRIKQSNDEYKSAIQKHLCSCYEWPVSAEPGQCSENNLRDELGGIRNPLTVPFDASFEGISPGGIPDLVQESKTKVVILEFFTQCCINCIHSIEEIRSALHDIRTERRDSAVEGKCEVKLISIHSPKFTRERNKQSVMDFVDRMKMTHGDVVNDPEMKLWNSLAISCWPTILVFGPSPKPAQGSSGTTTLNLIYSIKGEGHGTELKTLLQTSLDYFNKQFNFDKTDAVLPGRNLGIEAEEVLKTNSILKYPGKVVYYKGVLAIADSGNNRVLISTPQGSVQEIIGGTDRGLKDGDFKTARFYNPQGLAFQNEKVIFVADTGNHAVRRVDLESRQVTTWIQPNASPRVHPQSVLDEPLPSLKSPWDLTFYDSHVLLIAAAGSHQIFGYFFETVKLFGTEHAKDSFQLIAGTGKEENRNNSYILKSAFAQPSGICVSRGVSETDKVVYIADSESSSIRSITSTGKVMALVGGNRDPCDLFTYGDKDGTGYEVKLQHPVGVCPSGDGSSKVFIADTYNSKVKVIDASSKRCYTLIGNGSAGNILGEFSDCPSQTSDNPCELVEHIRLALLNEPGGITIDDRTDTLYIADTNNHCVKIGNLLKRNVDLLDLKFDTVDSGISTSAEESPVYEYDQVFTQDIPIHKGEFDIVLNFPNIGMDLEGLKWRVESFKNVSMSFDNSYFELPPESLWEKKGIRITGVQFQDEAIPIEFSVKVDLFFCGDSTCSMQTKRFKFILPPPSDSSQLSGPIHFDFDCTPTSTS